MKVTALQCGSVRLPAPAIYRDETAKYPDCLMMAKNPPERLLTIPVYAFLIEHDNGKKLLLDTGWSDKVRRHALSHLGIVNLTEKAILPDGQCIHEQLHARGISPDELDCVVLSHLHVDHAGGIRSLSGARRFLCSEEELSAARKGSVAYRKSCWKGVSLETFSWSDMGLGPTGKACDLYGDGTILLVSVPGHTPGQCAMLLRSNGNQLLLTADNGYSRRSWQDMVLPGHMTDPENTRHSLEWVRQFSEAGQGILAIISSHEPDLMIKQYVF